MISSEETSSQLSSAITKGLERALVGFAYSPNDAEARKAVVAALTTVVEVEARRLIAENVRLETKGGKVEVSIAAPAILLLRDLLGAGDRYCGDHWSFAIEIPKWERQDPTELPMTRPYIDPRTKRPTRGHPM